MRDINKIILHCSASRCDKDFDVNDIKEWHLQRGFTDVGYHYIIKLNGEIQEGRNIRTIGAHCKGYNYGSIGICYIGGLDEEGNPFDTRTLEQKDALFELVDDLLLAYDLTIEDVHCHYEYAKKLCPCFGIEKFRLEYLNWKHNYKKIE